MVAYLPHIQVLLGLLLIGGILLQRSEASLGSAFGGDSSSTRFSRRGLERTLFRATAAVAILFVLAAFANLVLGR